MSKGFETWWDSCESDIISVQRILALRLSDEQSELMAQLTEIEAWHGRVTSMKAWANTFLSEAERKVLMERAEDWTDLDRRADQKWKTADQRRAAEILEGLADGIKNRLILGMSLMKAQSNERVSGRVLS